MTTPWIKTIEALPHPDIEVLACYSPQPEFRVIRRGHCYFNQRGARYWELEEDVHLYPHTMVDYWMYFPEFPK
jgi:hypothetical protein